MAFFISFLTFSDRKRFCFKFTAKAISKYGLFICAIVGIFLLTEFLDLGLLAYVIELLVGAIALFIFKMITDAP